MKEQVKKLIIHQTRIGVTEIELCNEIGISNRTLYSIRAGKEVGNTTINKINKYILEKGL
jgi:predicted transcriptional regulator